MPATKTKPKSRPAIHSELVEAAESMATPIEFDQLIADGVLQKAGGGWYEVLDPARLPQHALGKIKAVKSRNRVRFRKPSKKLARFLDCIAAQQTQG